MKLCDLVAVVVASGEQAVDEWRRVYETNVETLHASDPAKMPGSPPLATVVPLETLGPKRLMLTTHVTLAEQDGAVEADFAAPAEHWWQRNPRNVSTLVIEWDRREAPEGVCRIRDRQNLRQDKVGIDG